MHTQKLQKVDIFKVNIQLNEISKMSLNYIFSYTLTTIYNKLE